MKTALNDDNFHLAECNWQIRLSWKSYFYVYSWFLISEEEQWNQPILSRGKTQVSHYAGVQFVIQALLATPVTEMQLALLFAP